MPPSSPVHTFEQLNSEFIPFWNQFDMLPQELLKNLLSDEGKTNLSPEMKTQLAMMKKKPPLEKSRPDSAISAKMFLSVHRLTLQRPALRYPEHFRKLHYDLKTEGRSAAARSPGTIPPQLHFSYLILVPVQLHLWPQSYRVTCRTQETAVLRSSHLVPSGCPAWS